MSLLVDLVLVALAAPMLGIAGYLCLLALWSRRVRAPVAAPPSLRFDIVVPAHDEEEGVARTVRNLLALDYPAHLRRVLVVADNCADATAARAHAAGAIVIERHDPARRGKGYALSRAFERCLADRFAEAVVVVDADTVASPDLLQAFSARLREGASVVQAHYTVSNPQASWRTRLMAIAFCLFHKVRSLARERLRVSVGLRGNGMCFATSLLQQIPHDAYSIVEDLEYGIRIGMAGHRVYYADDAVVSSEMVSSEKASRSQRRRWEDGRREIRRKYALPLLVSAVRRRDRILLDLAIDLLVPPLAVVAAAVGAGLAGAALLSLSAGHVLFALYVWAACAVFLSVYVVRGIWLANMGIRGVLALLYAPVYVAWRIVLPFLGGGERREWVRTPRERPERASAPRIVVASSGPATLKISSHGE